MGPAGYVCGNLLVDIPYGGFEIEVGATGAR
jgi:hypothetical protein